MGTHKVITFLVEPPPIELAVARHLGEELLQLLKLVATTQVHEVLLIVAVAGILF